MFKGTVPAIAAKEYTMCYCDDQAAGGGNVSSSSSKYTVTQDYVCDLDPNADGQYGCFEGGDVFFAFYCICSGTGAQT